MRITLTILVLILAGTALTILWKPYRPAKASTYEPKVIVLDDEPKQLGRVPSNPPRRDSESTQSIPKGRVALLDKGTTKASWYDTRPTYCYKPGRTRVPLTELWVAHKTLPCGTLIEVSGPKGTLVLPVWDRGPYIAGRDFDLSAKAFQHIVGPLSQGVGTVSYRVMA